MSDPGEPRWHTHRVCALCRLCLRCLHLALNALRCLLLPLQAGLQRAVRTVSHLQDRMRMVLHCGETGTLCVRPA